MVDNNYYDYDFRTWISNLGNKFFPNMMNSEENADFNNRGILHMVHNTLGNLDKKKNAIITNLENTDFTIGASLCTMDVDMYCMVDGYFRKVNSGTNIAVNADDYLFIKMNLSTTEFETSTTMYGVEGALIGRINGTGDDIEILYNQDYLDGGIYKRRIHQTLELINEEQSMIFPYGGHIYIDNVDSSADNPFTIELGDINTYFLVTDSVSGNDQIKSSVFGTTINSLSIPSGGSFACSTTANFIGGAFFGGSLTLNNNNIDSANQITATTLADITDATIQNLNVENISQKDVDGITYSQIPKYGTGVFVETDTYPDIPTFFNQTSGQPTLYEDMTFNGKSLELSETLSSNTYEGIISHRTQTNPSWTFGQLVARNETSGDLELASHDSLNSIPCMGVYVGYSNGKIKYLIMGKIDNSNWNFGTSSFGKAIYAGLSGGIATDPTSLVNTQCIGYIINENEIMFNPSYLVVE